MRWWLSEGVGGREGRSTPRVWGAAGRRCDDGHDPGVGGRRGVHSGRDQADGGSVGHGQRQEKTGVGVTGRGGWWQW